MSAPTAAQLREHLKAKGSNARCPAHDDTHGSLSISAGENDVALFKCHAGCSQEAVISALQARGIWPKSIGLTVAELATAKRLPESLLRESGFADDEQRGRPVVRMDYRDAAGKIICVRYRGALSSNGSDQRFWFRRGDSQQLFGLWRLRPEPVILVEGETDALALWAAGFNALGVPGAEAWRDQRFAELLQGCPTIYVHIEPDGGGEKFRAAFEKSSVRERVKFFTVAPGAKDPCELRARDTTGFQSAIDRLLESAKPPEEEMRAPECEPEHQRRAPISWDSLEGREPPPREWIIPHWIPHRHMTLLAGRGGVGKTLIAQHIATALALGHEYIEPVEARRVLMWAGEDDHAELWRRQIHISSWMMQPLSALTERLYLHSYAGEDITLLAPVYGALAATPMLTELREQVADYRAEVVILDNIARLYGGSENDRHAVTTFCAIVQGACAPAAVILLGHPAKAAGSEYSGSTAWEGAVRARLYLSDRPPDQDPQDDDAPMDDHARYLSRRKANYSALDIRRIALLDDGVLAPDPAEPARMDGLGGRLVQDIVERAVRTLALKDIYGCAATNSSHYLPRLARKYGLLETTSEKSFAKAMCQMVIAGTLVSREVGRYANRTPRLGLVIPS